MTNNENKQIKNAGRWWESYLVRYSIGTVVGAVLVYALLDQFAPDLKTKALMMPNITKDHISCLISACNDNKDSSACMLKLSLMQDLYGFNFSQLLLLGVYGLAFCYIASVPVLVAHAIRRHYNLLSWGKERNSTSMKFLVISFVFALVTALIFILNNNKPDNSADSSARILLIAISVFVLVQIVILLREYRLKNESWYFYVYLNKARNHTNIDLDSYRHLRENGNAFLIVVFEVILFAGISAMFHIWPVSSVSAIPPICLPACQDCLLQDTLTTDATYWSVLVLLVAWILPGAMVYFLGQRIEALMIEAENTPHGMPCSPSMESEAKPD